MLTRRIIPCLDVRDGRVVKGVRFTNLRDAGDPVEQACRYEAQGADEIVLLDVSATEEDRTAALDTVRAVRSSLSIPLTVGGGVRSLDDALGLLSAGADKVGVNTAAVDHPQILYELAQCVGSQCVVLAIDAAARIETDAGWEVITRAGTYRTGMNALNWAKHGVELGAGEILLTSWDRDGTRAGYDLELLSAVHGAVRVPIIASGGASTPEHMIAALDAGADAVLAASIFHDGETTVRELKTNLASQSIEVRP